MPSDRHKESLRRARALLAETPASRERARAAAERAEAEAVKKEARRVVAQMIERQKAMDQIDATLDEVEDVASPYSTTIIWGPSPEMKRALAQSKAHALLRDIELMEFRRAPSVEIWKLAVLAKAHAILADDRVLASNAAEIVAKYRPRKTYSLAERIAIHTRAKAMVADYKPSPSQPARKIKTDRDVKFRRLATLIDRLRARTVANGCTPSEAKAAREKVHDLLRAPNAWRDAGLSAAELEVFRLWYSRRGS